MGFQVYPRIGSILYALGPMCIEEVRNGLHSLYTILNEILRRIDLIREPLNKVEHSGFNWWIGGMKFHDFRFKQLPLLREKLDGIRSVGSSLLEIIDDLLNNELIINPHQDERSWRMAASKFIYILHELGYTKTVKKISSRHNEIFERICAKGIPTEDLLAITKKSSKLNVGVINFVEVKSTRTGSISVSQKHAAKSMIDAQKKDYGRVYIGFLLAKLKYRSDHLKFELSRLI